MVGILILTFGIGLFLNDALQGNALIPSVFVLGVFLISVFTDGFVYGIIAAIVSMLAVNYAFTFPYFLASSYAFFAH